jgi:exodeoxyribonuclease V gamma subunit
MKAARDKYDGGYSPGEAAKSASLGRAYPDFDALSASGEFATLADMLLGPLILAVKKQAKDRDKAADSAAGANE